MRILSHGESQVRMLPQSVGKMKVLPQSVKDRSATAQFSSIKMMLLKSSVRIKILTQGVDQNSSRHCYI